MNSTSHIKWTGMVEKWDDVDQGFTLLIMWGDLPLVKLTGRERER